MARRFIRLHKKRKYNDRIRKNKVAMQQSIKNRKINEAKQHVINLSRKKLTDQEYVLLSKGLKFIPTPSTIGAKTEILRDFDEFSRKLRCRFLFSSDGNRLHPFRENTGYIPNYSCEALENYIFQTKLDLSSMKIERFRDNLSHSERSSIQSLKNDKTIIIKKADKSSNFVILDKDAYLSEANKQLSSNHYKVIDQFDFTALRYHVNEYLNDMYKRNVLDKITYEYLIKGNQKTYGPGHLHILPKIHKLNSEDLDKVKENKSENAKIVPPGRPIISQIGTITEFVSRYIDYLLVPIVQKQHTYIRDSSDVILKLESIKPQNNCILCSFDISQMYTNCPIDEIVSAVRTTYDKYDKSHLEINYPPTEDLIYLLKIVLENNVFDFNGQLYQQCIGSAIGTSCAPEVCSILMYQIMNEILSLFEKRENIFFYKQYLDDGIFIYHGCKSELDSFFELANNHHRFLKFTYELSETDITFLDVHLFKGRRFLHENILDIKTHFKPTNSFLYLQRDSCHKKHVFRAFIHGEIIRYRRSTNNDNDLQEILAKFKLNLIKRGYKENEIVDWFNEAMSGDRNDLIKSGDRSNVKKDIPLVMTTKYNPCITKIHKKILKHWHLIDNDVVCKKKFPRQPMIAYKRHKNLADLLTSTKINN